MSFYPITSIIYYFVVLFTLKEGFETAGLTGLLLIFAAILLLYARFIEPYRIKIKKYETKITNLKNPVTIAFVADLQVGIHKKTNWVNKVASHMNGLKPDMVLFGGDLITNEGGVNESEHLLGFKEAFDCPSFTVLGNHDYGVYRDLNKKQNWKKAIDRSESVINALESCGIKVLNNELIKLNIRGEEISLYGADDLWSKKLDWNLSGLDHASPLLVLAHNPDSITSYPTETKKPDLVLSGHTHAGQVRIPFFGPLFNMVDLDLGRKFYEGFKEWNDFKMIITRGMGESLYPIRLFAPPEICFITLLPE